MALEVGSIVEGKVTGITKFGAFVSLPEGKSGLVHISEIANSFVSDVHDHVQMGQTVKVRVLKCHGGGEDQPLHQARPGERPGPAGAGARPAPCRAPAEPAPRPAAERTAADGPSSNADFEDRLKKFMQESDSRIADNRIYADHRSRNRRR